jgi:hypothetical protein
MFKPDDALSDLPCPLEHLTARRWTIVHYEGSKTNVVLKDNWTDVGKANRALEKQWTGQTIFKKKPEFCPASSSEAPPASVVGVPVVSPQLSANLSVLRTELAAAQRQDPRLSQIISYLEKKPAGTYLVQPRTELAKVKHDAESYRLAADGVLILKVSDELMELPVVPDVLYSGSSKLAQAPKRMSWKHLLLASMHNTSTGLHKNANEMYNELESVVAWHPPGSLRGDCQKWVDRCKHCVGVHRRPIGQPPPKPVLEHRPFFRIQIDHRNKAPW